MNQTAAIVVTFNRKDMLVECISRLLAQEGAACDILIIDNGSTDGTETAIKERIDAGEVIYFNTGKNLGGAGGFNYGMRKAVELGYTYVWIMDDDTFPDPGALAALLEADLNLEGKYGFLSSVAYWKDGSLCNMNRQHTSLRGRIEELSKPLVEVEMATFVSFFVRASMIRAVGLPISDFFIWSDDLEYSRRISRKTPSFVVTGSRVLHNMGSNNKVGIEQDSLDRLWRYEYMYRNEVYVYKREGFKGMCYLRMRIVLHLLRVLLKAKEGKGKKLSVIWRSYRSGKKFHPPIEFPGQKEQSL